MSRIAWLADEARRVIFQGSFKRRDCTHVRDVAATTPATGCRGCEVAGSRWVHLRACLSCGVVGCCDSSPGRHARSHFEETGHPAIRSIEPGEEWVWCYVDRAYLSTRPQGKD
jgi:uncharacterized UBP type Zn finger protein